MTDYLTNDEELSSVADAIRAKGGTSDALAWPDGFASAVEAIQAGGGGEDYLAQRITNTLTDYSSSEVTSIGDYALYYCSSIANISCPAATSIGGNAFCGCSSLASASFQSATSIGSSAFNACQKLANISFPAVTSIGNYALFNCPSLASASFQSATSIGNAAFQSCKKLASLVITQSRIVCTLSNTNAFNSTPIASGTGYIYVPDALVDSYKAATNWSTYASQIKPLSEWEG